MRGSWIKYAATLAVGVLAGVVISEKRSCLRTACKKVIGGALELKDRAMESAEILKESAEDLIAESREAYRSGKTEE